VDLRPSSEQRQLVDTFSSLYRKESTPARVRAAEPGGFDKALWELLLELGVLAMSVPEAAGGWGATLLDLALVAEEQGRHLASAPVIETQVAARLLARLGGGAAAAALERALSGERLVTLALRPATEVATLVPAGAVADDVLVLARDRLVLVVPDDGRVPVDNLGSSPLADVPIGSAPVDLAGGPEAVDAHRAALDDWQVLTANALVGLAAGALDLGVAYAKERHAWGRPIGAFQGVAHRLADVATAVDGARLLAREAAWAAADLPSRASELAAMAFAFASETARDATYWSLHVHGGYGFMLEYDVQLYYRRARAWARVLDSPATAYRRVAERRGRRS
jgi:alkylation response protein AidB-like acyl-CoA dehydrogenase